MLAGSGKGAFGDSRPKDGGRWLGWGWGGGRSFLSVVPSWENCVPLQCCAAPGGGLTSLSLQLAPLLQREDQSLRLEGGTRA